MEKEIEPIRDVFLENFPQSICYDVTQLDELLLDKYFRHLKSPKIFFSEYLHVYCVTHPNKSRFLPRQQVPIINIDSLMCAIKTVNHIVLSINPQSS